MDSDILVSAYDTDSDCEEETNQSKRQKSNDNKANDAIQRCSSPSLLTSKTKQELIQRNKYLERRVQELEKLNHTLQFGLLTSIKSTIIETLNSTFPSLESSGTRCNFPLSPKDAHEVGTADDTTSWSINGEEDPIISSVTSTSRTPDALPGTSAARTTPYATQESVLHQEMRSPPVQIESSYNERIYPSNHITPSQLSYVKDEQEYENTPISLVMSNNNSNYSLHQQALPDLHNTLENNHDIQYVTSSISIERVNEMAMAAKVCTNYKKLTNKLLSIFFDREELACNTLTGKSKGERTKGKLDESTVNMIINQAMLHFPGTTPSDVRMVISQNCKDKAMRFNKHQQGQIIRMANQVTHQETSQPSYGACHSGSFIANGPG